MFLNLFALTKVFDYIFKLPDILLKLDILSSIVNSNLNMLKSILGTETVLLAESHLMLRHANNPNFPFHEAYSFGKSTKNQRIEAWWNILTEGQTQEWKEYFNTLEGEGLFDSGNIDKACLQYIYMDMIRLPIHNFIEVHNSHPIRKQKKRDHYLSTGKPFEMYFYPDGVEDFKVPIEEEVLVLLESEVGSFDLDSFLPTETLNLFSNF